MTAIDWIVLAILAGSAVLGVMRGLVREVFSLGAWVVAFFGAKVLSPYVAPLVPGVGDEGLRYVAAISVVFVALLIAASLLGALLSSMVRLVGLGPYDKALGAGFGVLRALVLLLVLTVLAGLTAMPRTEAWQASASHGALERMAREVQPWLPDDLAALIRFDADRI